MFCALAWWLWRSLSQVCPGWPAAAAPHIGPKKHGYTTRPDLEAWLEPYVKAGWKITAFKIARDASRQEIATSAVRMSFTADKPFFPYSEPAEQREPRNQGDRRLLRVFFVADRRYQGELGNKKAWPGKTVWAGALLPAAARQLTEHVNPTVIPEKAWLTTFEDSSSPRPGTEDLFFRPSPTQEEVRRPPIGHREMYDLSGWVCLGILALGPAIILRRCFRKWRPNPALPGSLPPA